MATIIFGDVKDVRVQQELEAERTVIISWRSETGETTGQFCITARQAYDLYHDIRAKVT